MPSGDGRSRSARIAHCWNGRYGLSDGETARAPKRSATEAMISRASGKPYDKLKTAFVYREASTLKSPQCTCAMQPGTLKMVSTDGDDTAKTSKLIPLPVNRPDPATDPETLANRDGELDDTAARRLLSKDGDDLKLAERTVRVVGPAFLPDPSTAKARPTPAQTAVP